MIHTVYELSRKQQPPTVADLQQRFGDSLTRKRCPSSADCEYEVGVSNWVLAPLRFAPHIELSTHLWTRNGVVLGSMTNFTINSYHAHSIVAHVQIDFCDSCQWFTIAPWQASSLDTNGLVEIGQKSSAKNRQAALSMNADCLTKLGGCKSVADLLPSVWKIDGDRIICVVENDRGLARR